MSLGCSFHFHFSLCSACTCECAWPVPSVCAIYILGVGTSVSTQLGMRWRLHCSNKADMKHLTITGFQNMLGRDLMVATYIMIILYTEKFHKPVHTTSVAMSLSFVDMTMNMQKHVIS